jgi:hypothetical protein
MTLLLGAALLALACSSGCGSAGRAGEALAASAAAVEVTRPADLAPGCDASDPARQCSPRFNQVFTKSTHNSYWVNNITTDDIHGAGPQQRLWDQLVHEHVRSIELDLHKDIDDPLVNRGYHPGEFRVYHTNKTDNSTCFTLADCLQLLQRLDYVLPNHEVVVIHLEFKQLDRPGIDDSLFDAWNLPSDFHPEDLDRVLWEHLGSRLYTPGEFMSQCDADHSGPIDTLRDCAGKDYAQWPTIDELRGRYIVTVHGTEQKDWYHGAINERAWWKYAGQDDGQPLVDIRHRAAFPMTVIGGDAAQSTDAERPAKRAEYFEHPGDPGFIARYRRALDNTIFFDLEAVDGEGGTPVDFFADSPDSMQHKYKAVIRAKASHLIDTPVPNCGDHCNDNVGAIRQDVAVASGFQLFMTDFPANFISDFFQHEGPDLPSRVDRPFFEAYDVGLGARREFPYDSLREPGQRIYFETGQRWLDRASVEAGTPRRAHDLRKGDEDQLVLENDPLKQGEARLMRTAPPRAEEPVEDWEVAPSTSMETHTDPAEVQADKHPPLELTPFGKGCFVAESKLNASVNRDGDFVQLCRDVSSDNARDVYVEVTAHGGSAGDSFHKREQLHLHVVQGQALGDVLRVRVDRGGAGTTVTLWTAAEANPDGTLFYQPLDAGPFHFDTDLIEQGLLQENDGVFTGTRLNGGPLDFAQFRAVSRLGAEQPVGHITDLSYCGADGQACRPRAYGRRETIQTPDGDYVRVHQAHGELFKNQARTLYTTNRFEAYSSGLGEVTEGKLLLRNAAPDASWAPVYRCVDWHRDMHVYYLSLSLGCENPGGDRGMPSGGEDYLPDPDGGGRHVLGYISRTPGPGLVPVYHLRDGTGNATDGHNTHDHLYAVGDADRDAWKARNTEFQNLGIFGYAPESLPGMITFDLRGLSMDAFVIYDMPDGREFDSHKLEYVSLAPGMYIIQLYSSMMSDVVFTVKDDGTLDYDDRLEGAVSGKGTRTLTVKGFPIDFDARQLSMTGLQPLLFGAPAVLDTSKVQHLWLMPSPGYGFIAGSGQIPGFGFGVDLEGNPVVSADEAGFASVDGKTLVLSGYPVDVNVHTRGGGWVEANLFGLFGGVQPADQVVHLRLLPLWVGAYSFYDAVWGAIIPFAWNLSMDGKVQFDESYDGVASGRGTTQLEVTVP